MMASRTAVELTVFRQATRKATRPHRVTRLVVAQGGSVATGQRPAFLPTSLQAGDVDRGPHSLAAPEEVEARRAAIKQRAADRQSQKATYGAVAVLSASGITFLAVVATYFKFACVERDHGGHTGRAALQFPLV